MEKESNRKGRAVRSPLAFPAEQRVLSFLERHLYLIAFAVITILALVIRRFLIGYVSGDAYHYLLPWYEEIKDAGGFAGLAKPVGNYNMFYQFWIALFTYLPIRPLFAYKLFSILFDFLLAALGARIIYKNASSRPRLKAVVMYAAILLSPLVFLNSSYWAQCDGIYAFFCVFSLYEMVKDKYAASMLLFGAAMAFKLQAIFILPVLLFCWFYKKKFSCLYFLLVPAVMVILSLPGLVQGRKLTEVFSVYFVQIKTYKQMSLNYPSFWTLFQESSLNAPGKYAMFSRVAIVLTVGILLVYLIIWLKKRVRLNFANLFSMAFLVVYTCVLFLPAMHERYGYLYEILGLFVAFLYYKTIPMLALTYSVSIISYGLWLFLFDVNMGYLSLLNLAAYAAYAFYLNKQLLSDTEPAEQEISAPLKA